MNDSNNSKETERLLKKDVSGKYLGKQRKLKGYDGTFISIVAISMTVYHAWALVTGMPEPLRFRPIHVAFALILVFGLYPLNSHASKDRIPWYDILIIIGIFIATAYLQIDFNRIVYRYAFLSPVEILDYFFAAVLVLSVLEAVRRSFGLALSLVAVVVMIHGLFGQYFPGIFRHTGVSLTRLTDQLFLIPSGIFGRVTAVSSTYVFGFILLGSFLIAAGGDDFFMLLASTATKKLRGGPAKSSVIGSALFGMVSGSTVSNVYTTGTITIPLMKKSGFKDYFAGAVEAAASTVGQWMPPAMGSSAFLIAEYTGLGYVRVMAASFLPATLYVLSVYSSVHFRTISQNIGTYIDSRLKSFSVKKIMLTWGHLLLPVILLLSLLLRGYSAYFSALLSTGALIVISFIKKETRFNLKIALNALESTGYKMCSIASALICASIILGVLELSGLPLKFTAIIIRLSGGNLLSALLLIMISSIFLGMGLPTAAAYVITMIFGVPALMELGVSRLAGHMFVFYFATLSSITPPVCMASFAAAAVSGAPAMKVGFEGVKLAIVAYLIPFAVVYRPHLMMEGTAIQVIIAYIITAIAAISLSSVAQNVLFERLIWVERLLLLIGSIVLVIQPSINVSIVGFFCVIIGFTIHLTRTKLKSRKNTINKNR